MVSAIHRFADHRQHEVVPILVYQPAAGGRLQLNLEVTASRRVASTQTRRAPWREGFGSACGHESNKASNMLECVAKTEPESLICNQH